jgi:hypothetical protein
MLPEPDTLRQGMSGWRAFISGDRRRDASDMIKAARDGVKRPHIRQEALVVEPLGKGNCKIDVEEDIRQAIAFGFRKHRSRRP